MTTRNPTLCAACVHLRAEGRVCEAFPGGIPRAIFLFGADHRQPRAGDHGITFKLAPGEQALDRFADWAFVFTPEGGQISA